MDITDKYPDFYTTTLPRWGDTELALHSAPTVDGNPHEWEREALVRLIMRMNAKTVFEFGTFNGATAKVIALLPCVEKVWTLDLPHDKKPSMGITLDDWRFIHHKNKAEFPTNVTQLWGDSATFDFSPYYQQCDCVFVMGAHSVPYIQNDLARAFEIVNRNGVVILHAGTPAPIADIQRDYDLAMIGDRMALVLGRKDNE